MKFNQEQPDESWYKVACADVNEFWSIIRKKENSTLEYLDKWIPPPSGFVKLNCDASFKTLIVGQDWGC